MNTAATIPDRTPVTGNLQMLRAMVGIGVVCAFLIVSTFEVTLPTIEKNKAAALERAVFRVLPEMSTKANYILNANGGISLADDDKAIEGELFYVGYKADGSLAGMVVEGSGQGFADVLKILYGYDPHRQAVVGYYVLESKETPGLGDKIEKDPAFLANFESLDVRLSDDGSGLLNKVVPVKKGKKTQPWQVDGITGATISSKAIGNIIGNSTERWVPILYASLDEFVAGKNDQE